MSPAPYTACEICRREAAEHEPLGGWVLRTEHWSACVGPGFEVPGWLFLELRRHAEGPMAMDPAEAGEVGHHLVELSDAIRAATGAEKVYVVAFGEVYAHFHLLLLPRMPFAPPEETGPALLLRRQDLLDGPASAEMALRVCRALSGGA